MPGTIQVTVLEFKGASSSPSPSAKSLKVSMGKRHYQTWDKGEVAFPITKLGEDLMVALLDAGGNVIDQAGIRTMEIIEKGFWDEVFTLNRGGHVHMKLQFVLSEEERNRIRVMRVSALKKKLETNPNINHRLAETISVETSKKDGHNFSGSSSDSSTSSATSSSSYLKGGVRILENAVVPSATDGNQYSPTSSGKSGVKIETPRVHERRTDEQSENESILNLISENKEEASSRLSLSAVSGKNISVVPSSRDGPSRKSRDQAPREKISSNVKKMISTFENSQLQELKSLKKTLSIQSELNKLLKHEDKSMKKAPSVPSRLNRYRNEQLPGGPQELDNVPSAPTEASREQTVKEVEKLPENLTRQSISGEAMTSGRMLSTETLNSCGNSAEEGSRSESGRGMSLKRSTVVNLQEISKNAKPKCFLESFEDEKGRYCPSSTSGMWIFPDNTRQICATTSGKQAMNIRQDHSQAKARFLETEVGEKNVVHGAEYKTRKNEETVSDQPESGCSGSPGDSSNGHIGQVVKIAVILGFGVFVLLTRQKEPRKKDREMYDNLAAYHPTLLK